MSSLLPPPKGRTDGEMDGNPLTPMIVMKSVDLLHAFDRLITTPTGWIITSGR